VRLLSIALVLDAGGRAQIGFSIVEAITVDVIDEHIIGNREYLPVHV
jgi:hypothetical protein